MEQSADSETVHPLMRALIEKLDAPRTYVSTYRLFRGPSGSEKPDSILDVLELKAEELSPIAREALEALDGSSRPDDEWWSFRWKLTAFLHLQDAFDSVLYKGVNDDAMILFQQYYFYFESVRILRESLLCGLHGLSVAASALLRPFLEFSLLQNYFCRTLDESRTFAPLHQYFKTRIAPNTSTLVKKSLPKVEFTRPIRFRLQSHLAGLSQSTMHPYHPDHSAGQCPIRHAPHRK